MINKKSPKGIFRMWQLIPVFILVGFLAYIVDPIMLEAWGAQLIIKALYVLLGLFMLYWGVRLFVHTRTHELDPFQQETRNCYLIISVALVIAGALLTS